MKTFIISENDSGQRMDKFVRKAVPLLPKSLMYKFLRTKKIKRNRKRCQPSDFLEEGDILELYINDEFFEYEVNLSFLESPKELCVVYEDENLMIIDKPVGLVVHEDSNSNKDTLINRVQHYLYNKKEYDPKAEHSFAPALCNRIDRNTSGLVIAAKNARALRLINEKIRMHEITKKYFCLVEGIPPQKQDTVECWIKKNNADNTVNIFKNEAEGSLYSKTGYTLVNTVNNTSLLEVELFTGRTHQIRAVMSYIGCPIMGDTKYGAKRIKNQYQALCSYSLHFHFGEENSLSYLNGKTFTVEKHPFPNFIVSR